MNKIIYCLLILSIYLIDLTIGESACSTYTDSTNCNDDESNEYGYCQWISSSYCGCNNAMDQDIIFLIDSSSNVDDTEFESMKTFINNILDYASPTGTVRVGLRKFTTADIEIISLNDNIDASNAKVNVSSMVHDNSNSMNAKDSVTAAVEEFDTYSTNNERRVLIILIAGISENAFCTKTLHFNDDLIDSYVIAIGNGWEKRAYKCAAKSNNNYEGLISIGDASDLPDSSQQHSLELLVCPHHPSIIITEVQPSRAHGIYIEGYNQGYDFLSNFLEFTGLFDGYTQRSFTISQGSYFVFYDGTVDVSLVPNCTNCNDCTPQSDPLNDGSTVWCDDALYFSCGATPSNSESWEMSAGTCDPFYDASPGTQSVKDWDIQIYWATPSPTAYVLIENVTYKANVNNYYLEIINDTGLSYELKSIGYYNGFGTSWAISCDQYGTPGSSPLTSCTDGCSVLGLSDDICQAAGDVDAVCDGTSCTCGNSAPYYEYNDIICLPLPQPSNCSGYVDDGINPDYYVDIEAGWDGIWEFDITICEACTTDGTTTTCEISPDISECSLLSSTRYGLPAYQSTGTKQQGFLTYPGMIKLIDDISGENKKSLGVNCTVETPNPTMSPTPQPTLGIDSISDCEYLLDSDLNGFTLTWTEITVQQSDNVNISFIDGVIWYDKDDSEHKISTVCCSAYADLTGETFVIGSDEVYLSPDYSDSETDVTDAQELSVKTLCTEKTQSPTQTPSNQPTRVPSARPTRTPTTVPTDAPTFAPLVIPNCTIEFIQSYLSYVSITWTDPEFIWPYTVNKSQVTYKLYYKGAERAEPNSNPYPFTLTNWNSATDWDEDIEMYIEWSVLGETNLGDNTICNKYSQSPTQSPTTIPTTIPSNFPTKIPSLTPSNNPTTIPTQAPTYTSPNLTWCHASFGPQNLDVTITWQLIELDDTYIDTPPPSDVEYVIYGLDSTNFVTQDQFDDSGNNTIVSKKYFISGFDIDNDEITMKVTYDNGEESPLIICNYSTSEPTLSPTNEPTNYPTISPTYGAVNVYLTRLSYCESDRCGCNNTKCSNYDTPIDIVREQSSSQTDFYVRRSELCYPYNISIKYNISFVTKAIAEELKFYDFLEEYIIEGKDSDASANVFIYSSTEFVTNISNLDYFIPNDTYYLNNDLTDGDVSGPTYLDVASGDWGGEFIMQSSADCCNPNAINPSDECPRNNLADFGIQFIEENQESLDIGGIAPDKDGEVFLISLIECNVVQNNSLYYNTNYTNDDNLTCILSYPYNLFVIVEDTNTYSENESSTVKNDSYNEWLWWVLLGIAIFLLILSYVVYKWWVNKRMKEQDVMDIEEDVDAVIQEQEQGFANDLDKDNVNFNPLAKPLAHIKGPTGTDLNNSNNGNSGEIADRAQVRVEKFNVKQEFGPTQAAQRTNNNNNNAMPFNTVEPNTDYDYV